MGVWVGGMLWATSGGRLRWDVGLLDMFSRPVKLLDFRCHEGVEMEEGLR